MTKSIRSRCSERQLEKLRAERDIYRRLLACTADRDLEGLIEKTLEQLVELSGALHGLAEVRDGSCLERERSEADRSAGWRVAIGFGGDPRLTDADAASRSAITEAIATGRTIEVVPQPVEGREVDVDPSLPSLLCVPICGDGVVGAVYVDGEQPFDADDRVRLELVAQLMAPLGERLTEGRRRASAVDAMQALRRLYRLGGIVGRAAALAAPCRQAMRAAGLDIHVLLTGASGTGKSQLARLIHENSARSAGPFIELNCATLPESLIESELFGARAGSHSQAKRDVPGKVAGAEGGTLFLDEIAELPIPAQAKLLQLIQSRDYYPLGSTRAKHADVRIVAATNIDLVEAVAERRFREDLFFRLHVMPIRLPGLAERREDVPLIAREVCSRVLERHRLPYCELSTSALRALRRADWPGNVRQLANVVEAAAIRAATEGSARIEPRHVFPDTDARHRTGPLDKSFHDATRGYQRKLLQDTLETTGWNVSEAARRLELARSHVYNLIHEFDLCRDHTNASATLPARVRAVAPSRLAAAGSVGWDSPRKSDAVQS